VPPLDRPSLAYDLFRRITEDDSLANLRAMVEEEPRARESELLEFKAYPWKDFIDPLKGCGPKNLKDAGRDFIKETWSQCLSAFANNAGGVLIWGIHAAKVDGVDEAQSFHWVPNPEALASRLMELHHEATDPPLTGAQAVPVIDPSEGGKGFVVCYIPQGEFVPYRAEHCQRHYFIRVGDDSIIPNRVMLRRLFYPQSLAKLKMSVVMRLNRITRGETILIDMDYAVYLMNDGTASARDVFMIATDNVPYPSNGAGLVQADNWKRISIGRNKTSFQANLPIHPKLITCVASSFHWNTHNHHIRGNQVFPNFDPFWMQFHVYSHDTDYRSFRVEFVQEDFLTTDMVEKHCVDVTE
jgi:hypothetical protein